MSTGLPHERRSEIFFSTIFFFYFSVLDFFSLGLDAQEALERGLAQCAELHARDAERAEGGVEAREHHHLPPVGGAHATPLPRLLSPQLPLHLLRLRRQPVHLLLQARHLLARHRTRHRLPPSYSPAAAAAAPSVRVHAPSQREEKYKTRSSSAERTLFELALELGDLFVEVVFLAFELELLLLKLGVGLLQLAQALPHGALVVAAAVCTCTHRFSLRGKRMQNKEKERRPERKATGTHRC